MASIREKRCGPTCLRFLTVGPRRRNRPKRVLELRFRAAKLVETELLEPEEAIRRYASVIDNTPNHEGTRQALEALSKNEDTSTQSSDVLESLYRAELNWDQLAELYERRLAMPGVDPLLRQQHLATLAEIHETSRGDDNEAFAVWARALEEAPEDESIQGQLERLAGSRGTWDELAKLYQVRLDELMDPELEFHYASRLGYLFEDAMGNLEQAAECYRRALDVGQDDETTLRALSRVYERAANWPKLAETLARQADDALDEDQQAELLFRLGCVHEQQLEQLSEAVAAFASVLERDPHHVAARGGLERLLSHESQRAQIIDILEPLYEGEGDIGRLADLLVTRLSIAEHSYERAQIYQRITELAEVRLGDPTRALDAAGGWLEEDPASEQALQEVERLANEIGRFGELAARLMGITQSNVPREVKITLLFKLGAVQFERLADLDAAEKTFNEILELEPEASVALESLEQIHRKRNDVPALCGILQRRGELAFDAVVKRNCFAELASLRESSGDDDAAIGSWRQVLEIDEGDREAHVALAAIFDRRAAWPELIEIHQLSARFAPAEEGVALRSRVAELYTDTLDDLENGADAWQSVLDLDPNNVNALSALEIVHSRREDWLAVQDVLTRRVELCDTDGERIGLLQKLARVAEEYRQLPDEAVAYHLQILDLNDAFEQAYVELERLHRAGEQWHELVDLLERAADVRSAQGDAASAVVHLARAADVWEGPLENPDAGGEILEKILARDPNYVPALTRLAKIYEGTADWERCSEVLEQALALGPTGTDAADLYFRLGQVALQRNEDVDGALRNYEQALVHDHAHAAAIMGVENVARERDDWPKVADMLRRRHDAESVLEKRLDLLHELSGLHSKILGTPESIIPLLEAAAEQASEEPRVLAPLADLYFANGEHAKSAPIYSRLADVAKKARKMKDVAKYRQRLGGIFEASGELDKALAAYDEAFRIDPTNVSTMAGLGRLHMDRQDWEKARRVYRSMVLQELSPDCGITKAVVYYNLGLIHMHLDEPKKAKGMFQRGLELEPDNAALKQALEEL